MRWPWRRIIAGDQLIVSWADGEVAFVRARPRSDGGFDVRQMGVERQGTDSREDFVRRLQALGLKGASAHIMLRPAQYQLLQIDVPAVAPEELRAAARYQIRDMVNVHIDDLTLDVMRVGDGQQKGTPHLFVVAAETAIVRDVLDLGDALHWTVSVIDIQETVQRNLQSLLARNEGRLERADAALLVADANHALLTISANEELFYARRLELPEGFMAMDWGSKDEAGMAVSETFIPVGEYVPEYNVGGVSHGSDYTGGGASASGDGNELAQRFLVEVQRSLDLWDRSWSSLPLSGLRVSAGARSTELAQWLGREMGQTVTAIDMGTHFSGLDTKDAADRAMCLPLLGALLRTEGRKL
ncbi:hypothetical protein [Rhodoferax saidenbachensis]|uniref:MSHA biogenesis protein MshI n=1 Tax=Rhodoferax saidenbachensis TaxID=1484693 RepID=A0ABU1ZN31_9BURK|nr:hypothetical protein [Rhodoferax saidenbachensis]MDR7306965.1 MSHA biogenesis protein MshI [Rhodoferax saidenbachensis]